MTVLTTDRLELIQPEPAHFDAYARCHGDAEVMKGLGQPGLDRAQAWRHFVGILGHWVYHGFGMFSVIEKDTGEWVGRVGPLYPEGWPDREIGWTIAKEHWGKGYAGEAGEAAIRYAFTMLGWNRVVHLILPDNTNSQRVAEKLGSRLLERDVDVKGFPEKFIVNVWGQDRA